jgi:hypothetical protein
MTSLLHRWLRPSVAWLSNHRWHPFTVVLVFFILFINCHLFRFNTSFYFTNLHFSNIFRYHTVTDYKSGQEKRCRR